MPDLKVSPLDSRLIRAMADERNMEPDDLLSKILADVRINYAGIHPDDIPEMVETRISKMEERGRAAKAARGQDEKA